MKILRSVSRRGFSVGTAGWFTVLKPNTWFAASRLRNDSHYLSGRTRLAAQPDQGSPTTPSLSVKLNANDPGLMRLGLTILGSMAITSVLLWWIMHP